MDEFEVKDYAGARSYADSIKINASNIMGIFDIFVSSSDIFKLEKDFFAISE